MHLLTCYKSNGIFNMLSIFKKIYVTLVVFIIYCNIISQTCMSRAAMEKKTKHACVRINSAATIKQRQYHDNNPEKRLGCTATADLVILFILKK